MAYLPTWDDIDLGTEGVAGGNPLDDLSFIRSTITSPSSSMARQGVDVALSRMHPAYLEQARAATTALRDAGFKDAHMWSAYRPSGYGVNDRGTGWSKKSMHGFGLAADWQGVPKMNDPSYGKFYNTMKENGFYNPYVTQGADGKFYGSAKEYNHWQITPDRAFPQGHPIYSTVTPQGPVNNQAMWEASGIPVPGGAASTQVASAYPTPTPTQDMLTTNPPLPQPNPTRGGPEHGILAQLDQNYDLVPHGGGTPQHGALAAMDQQFDLVSHGMTGAGGGNVSVPQTPGVKPPMPTPNPARYYQTASYGATPAAPKSVQAPGMPARNPIRPAGVSTSPSPVAQNNPMPGAPQFNPMNGTPSRPIMQPSISSPAPGYTPTPAPSSYPSLAATPDYTIPSISMPGVQQPTPIASIQSPNFGGGLGQGGFSGEFGMMPTQGAGIQSAPGTISPMTPSYSNPNTYSASQADNAPFFSQSVTPPDQGPAAQSAPGMANNAINAPQIQDFSAPAASQGVSQNKTMAQPKPSSAFNPQANTPKPQAPGLNAGKSPTQAQATGKTVPTTKPPAGAKPGIGGLVKPSPFVYTRMPMAMGKPGFSAMGRPGLGGMPLMGLFGLF